MKGRAVILQAPPEKPFVTRQSTLGFSLIATVVFFLFPVLISRTGGSTDGTFGALVAAVGGVGVVSLVVAMLCGTIFALRARSIVWIFAIWLAPPLGSLACALWCRERP